MKICALKNCDKIVTNWRISCCCATHQNMWAGGRAHGIDYEIKPISERKATWSAYVMSRQRKKAQSMPIWANKEKIQEFYSKARELSEKTGILHEVDHIIPSNNKLVCGLHNEFNLQVLPWQENRAKSNKFTVE